MITLSSLAVFRLFVNLLTAVMVFFSAYKLHKKAKSPLGDGIKFLLIGIGIYNGAASIIFLYTTFSKSFFVLGINGGWWYSVANLAETIPAILLALILLNKVPPRLQRFLKMPLLTSETNEKQ